MRCLALLVALSLATAAHAEEADKGFQELFNGRDLTGWEADERIWSVENGLLTGQTTADVKAQHNTFAIWTVGKVADFILRVEVRVQGDNNSGVQYRSQPNPASGKYSVVGYQADLHPAENYVGMLYDEGGRGIVAERGQLVVLGPDNEKKTWSIPKGDPIDLRQWCTLEVIAKGPVLQHRVNGQGTVTVVDNDPQHAEARGLLALQVHAGTPMKVQFRSVKLKRLDD